MSVNRTYYSFFNYRTDLDGLRCVAVLSVVFFHAFPNLFSGGFVGVDIFFVISGFLITKIIFNNLNEGSFSFADFYVRRIRRIFPSVIVVLVSSFIFAWFTLFSTEFKQLGKHIVAGAGFVSNIVLWSEAGYFDNSSQTKPLIHLWSLGIEEQFYIIWPFFLWFLYKYKYNFLIIIFFFTICSFILNIYSVTQNSVTAFYSPLTRFWELLIGSLLAIFIAHKKKNFLDKNNIIEYPKSTSNLKNDYQIINDIFEHNKWIGSSIIANFFSIIGLLLIFYSILYFDKKLIFPGINALLPVTGTVLIILAGTNTFVNRIVLSNKIVVWFGLISFPLYLWHWPLFSFAHIIESQQPNLIIRFTLLFISILLAWLTYKFFERPFRFGQNAKTKVNVLIISLVIIGCIGFLTYKKDGLKDRFVIKKYEIINSQFHNYVKTQTHWEYYQNESCTKRYFLDSFRTYPWFFCIINSEKKPTILILGSSKANDFYPGVILNRNLKHHSVLSFGNCDPALAGENWKYYTEINHWPGAPCWGSRHLLEQQHINNIIINEKSIKFIILGGLDPFPSIEYIVRLKLRIDFFESHGITVIIINPLVSLIDFNPQMCYSRPLAAAKIKNCSISINSYLDQKKKFLPLINTIKKTNPNVKFFDLNSTFCDEDKCTFAYPSFPVFRDAALHLSVQASKNVIDTLVDKAKNDLSMLLK
jgi:peptidoglycan/LPS O-acetylase OafA/YrhL